MNDDLFRFTRKDAAIVFIEAREQEIAAFVKEISTEFLNDHS